MAVSLTSFTTATAISASDIRERFKTIERYMNENILAADLQQTPAWVDTVHIFKPEFYGSPASRCHAVSADTHYRYTTHDQRRRAIHHWDVNGGSGTVGMPTATKFVAIPGLSATVKVPEASVPVTVLATFYCWEQGGENTNKDHIETTTVEAARFRLFSGETLQAGTRRSVYASMGQGFLLARKQHSFTFQTSLNAGIHHLSVRCQVQPRPTSDISLGCNFRHIWVEGRSFVVDLAIK